MVATVQSVSPEQILDVKKVFRLEAEWQEILRKAASGHPDSLLMAVIDSENLLDEILPRTYHMKDSTFFECISSLHVWCKFENFSELESAHLDVRNAIAHRRGSLPSQPSILNALRAFGAFLCKMRLIPDGSVEEPSTVAMISRVQYSRMSARAIWEEIIKKVASGHPDSLKLAVLDAESLVDNALFAKGMSGVDFCERMEDACGKSLLSGKGRLKKAHKLRNQFAHNRSSMPEQKAIEQALNAFEKALRELKVLQ